MDGANESINIYFEVFKVQRSRGELQVPSFGETHREEPQTRKVRLTGKNK